MRWLSDMVAGEPGDGPADTGGPVDGNKPAGAGGLSGRDEAVDANKPADASGTVNANRMVVPDAADLGDHTTAVGGVARGSRVTPSRGDTPGDEVALTSTATPGSGMAPSTESGGTRTQRIRDAAADWRHWLPIVALTALMVIETFFDLRRAPTPSPWLWNSYFFVYYIGTVICLMLWPRPATTFSRPGSTIVLSGTALMVYALVSASITPRPYVSYTVIPRSYLTVPILTALATLLLATAIIRVLPPGPLHRVLWWPAAATIVCSFLQWPRSAAVHGSARLATGMGGSAVVHVPLMLAAGVTMAAALAGWRRWWSLGLAALGVLAVVLTGSRAGVMCMLLAGVVIALQWLRSRRAWIGAGVVVVVAAILVTAVPVLHRLFNPIDELRAKNLDTSLTFWASTPTHILIGVGSGRLWPWYAFDSHLLRTPWRGMVTTHWGPALNSAHSTFLQVLVELGLVGCLLLAPVIIVPVVVLVRRLWPSLRRHARPDPEDVILVALVATIGAFLLDTYLLKNYGASLWWWLVALGALRRRPTSHEESELELHGEDQLTSPDLAGTPSCDSSAPSTSAQNAG
ncbi:O-antigen ligase family protein [Acidipropionibacterium jensenii]|nr:O-antigen ligase family protein [Acidipropionibacterium jensenii]